MANYAKKFYYVTQAQYEILQSGGTITVGDQTYTGIDPNAIYFVRPVADLYQIKWNANTDRLELWKNGVAVEGGEDAVRIGYATYSAMSGIANNSQKLNGEDPSYYLDYANFTGAPSLANYVNKTSNETVGGVKTFTSIPLLPNSNPSADNQAARKKYVDDGLASKQATITGAASTITANNLTASKALVSNASGKVAVSAITSNELGYLSGATSPIQTQINDINNNKVDNAPTDGKVYAQQYGDWTSLEDTAELRDALCFDGDWDPTSWTPRDVVDGGTI